MEQCPRCHGAGGYFERDEHEIWSDFIECQLCEGTGVVPVGTHDVIPFGED